MGHEAVLQSLDVALASSLRSVKLNVVVVKGLNDYEVLDFAEMTRDRDISIRFIEFMPFTGRVQPSLCVGVPAERHLNRKQVGQSQDGPFF
jgi:molybdenum cofactor biosynthesis enzyme MoaA